MAREHQTSGERPTVRGGRIGGKRSSGHAGGEAAMRSENVSAAQIQKYLKGVDYPADKQELIRSAQSNDAPENIMDYLNDFTEKDYNSPIDVEQEFGSKKRR